METIFPTIIKEDWAVAKLADGTVIRNRPVLFFGLTDPTKKGIQLRTGVQTIIWSPAKGTPDSTARTVKDLEKLAGKPIEPASRHDATCAYELPKGQLVLIRHKINEIRPTSVFNSEGEPRYVVNYGTELNILDYVDESGPSAPQV